MFEISTLKYFKMKVSFKTKKHEIWDQNYLICEFLGKILKKSIAILEISTPRAVS